MSVMMMMMSSEQSQPWHASDRWKSLVLLLCAFVCLSTIVRAIGCSEQSSSNGSQGEADDCTALHAANA
jgi:hypothetical protein